MGEAPARDALLGNVRISRAIQLLKDRAAMRAEVSIAECLTRYHLRANANLAGSALLSEEWKVRRHPRDHARTARVPCVVSRDLGDPRGEEGPPGRLLCALPTEWSQVGARQDAVTGGAGPKDQDGLNAMQRAFVVAYCGMRRPSATKAAIKAGYSPRTAHSQGPRLLEHVGVAAAIERLRGARLRKMRMGRDEILAQAAHCARGDVTDYLNWDADGETTWRPSKRLFTNVAVSRAIAEARRARVQCDADWEGTWGDYAREALAFANRRAPREPGRLP